MMPHFAGRRLQPLSIAIVLLATMGGCALFDAGLLTGARQMLSVDDLGAQVTETKKLPEVATPPNAICLDVTISERAFGDPLLDTLLWNDVEQVGVVSPETKELLTKHGFRVGHTGSRPPRALEKLLGMRSDFEGEVALHATDKMLTRRMVIPAGTERDIQTSEFYADWAVEIPIPTGVRKRDYTNARCVLKITPRKLQENWIRLDFVPEIHYGEERWRPMIIGGTWQGRTSQEIEPLYPLHFTVDLNLGEMVVISGTPSESETIGQHFFCVRDGENWRSHRLLVVRFSDMNRARSVYSTE